jgi:protein-L-isoaspartate(D-aspartate) O-methyltransferase
MIHKPNPHTTASFGFQRSLKAHGGSARKISLVLCQTDLHRSANLDDLRIEQAFRSVKRERFAGPGPWWLNLGPHRYVQTPDDDPAFLYQDLPLALDREREINMGMPSAHACWLGACTSQKLRPWQIGAGSGYYTAILAHLVGAGGRIYSYEIDEVLAERARDNLKGVHQVEVRTQSGNASDLPRADLIYVCAGATRPSHNWLAALRPGGRLLLPLAPQGGVGGMLLITRPDQDSVWPAKFVTRAAFIGCVGLQDDEADHRLTVAFSKNWDRVRSLRFDRSLDDSCWFAGDSWWLSTSDA